MSTSTSTTSVEQTFDEVSLQDVATVIWARRRLLASIAALFTMASVAVSLLLPVKYEASVVVVPLGDDNGGRLAGAGALLSQFGGLASISGMSLNGGTRKAESLATLQSAALTEAFIADLNLLPILYANDWDEAAGRWKSNDPEDIPTPWKAELKFRKNIRTIEEDKKSGVITLTVKWKNPRQAAEWANELVSRANKKLRDRAIDISTKNLEYLNEELSKTSVVEIRNSIYNLIEAEIKQTMIAKGSSEYAFRVVDPARVPEIRSSPQRIVIVFAGFIIGILVGIAIVLSGNKSSSGDIQA